MLNPSDLCVGDLAVVSDYVSQGSVRAYRLTSKGSLQHEKWLRSGSLVLVLSDGAYLTSSRFSMVLTTGGVVGWVLTLDLKHA